MSSSKKNLVVIVGPTAVGKTNLSLVLAEQLNCEVLSADSRQLYRELNIGTAKPTDDQLANVKHHFINSHSIAERYTVYDYARECQALLTSIYSRHNAALLVGGSGLFVDAVCNGLDELPNVDEHIRVELNAQLEGEGLQVLFEKLKELDPKYAEVVDENNPRRVTRALEVCLGTGKPFSSFLGKSKNAPEYTTCKIGLDIPRDLLYDRIDERVDSMVNEGLVEEVLNLVPYKDQPVLRTVGYQELVEHCEGRLAIDEAIELIKRNTRRYAKRQLTWFKRDPEIRWFAPDDSKPIMEYVQSAVGT